MAAKKSAKPAPAKSSPKPAKKAAAAKKVSSPKVKSPAAKSTSAKKAAPAKSLKAPKVAKPATSLKEKKAAAKTAAPAAATKKPKASPAKPTKKLPAKPATSTKKSKVVEAVTPEIKPIEAVVETPKKEVVPPPVSAPEKKAPTPEAAPSRSARREASAKKTQAPAQSPSNWNISQVKDEFIVAQYYRLLDLRDSLQDSMADVTNNNIRNRAEGSEASAFGMHQADAGSDAYDRDFALSLLSQEQNSLYDIMEALRRIENGTYGICEGSNKLIPRERLEAIPFARFTVEYQEIHEKENRVGVQRRQTRSLFGLDRDENSEDEEGSDDDSLDKNN